MGLKITKDPNLSQIKENSSIAHNMSSVGSHKNKQAAYVEAKRASEIIDGSGIEIGDSDDDSIADVNEQQKSQRREVANIKVIQDSGQDLAESLLR